MRELIGRKRYKFVGSHMQEVIGSKREMTSSPQLHNSQNARITRLEVRNSFKKTSQTSLSKHL